MIWFLNLFNKKTRKVENDKDLEIEIKLNKDFDDCLKLLKLVGTIENESDDFYSIISNLYTAVTALKNSKVSDSDIINVINADIDRINIDFLTKPEFKPFIDKYNNILKLLK